MIEFNNNKKKKENKKKKNNINNDNNNSNNNSDSMRADPPTPAKGNTPAREISPLGGRGLDPLTSALPYPRLPALCRKDTTYPWSNRLRSP